MVNGAWIAWIFDENVKYQNFLSTYLTRIGYTTHSFTNGEECLEYLYEKPDVIIVDDRLKTELNEIDVLRLIEENQPHVPVLSITGEEKQDLMKAALTRESFGPVERDNVNLMRLKIRLRKVQKLHSLRSKKRQKKMLFRSMVAAGLLLALMFFILR